MKHLPLLALGEEFFTPVEVAHFPEAHLVFYNDSWAKQLGLQLNTEEIQKHFWSFKPLPNNLPQTLAMKYHGHQFMHYNPQIGDGRGFTYAQFFDASSQSSLLELGTKGSGTTPYSRRGDGRLTLKGAFREILATEYLEAMGVNTSKTLAVFETKEQLIRHDEPSPTRSGVLTRLSQGHIRFGTFQRLLTENKISEIKKLIRYCVTCFYPQLLQQQRHTPIEQQFEKELTNENVIVPQFFSEVVRRHASLVASYMIAGFVHGVLNTDNMNIAGESFDYGPYRFLPVYDPLSTAAYFDQEGLYAFGRQPHQFLWNLEQLRICLEPAVENPEPLQKAMSTFQDHFEQSLIQLFLQRLRLKPKSEEENFELLHLFYSTAQKTKLSLDQFYFDITRMKNGLLDPEKWVQQDSELQPLAQILSHFETSNPQIQENSYFQNEKPQSLLIDEIEKIWETIDTNSSADWSPLYQKITLMRSIPKTDLALGT